MLVRRTYVHWCWDRASSWCCFFSLLRNDRWQSAIVKVRLGGDEVTLFACAKYGICNTVFPYRL